MKKNHANSHGLVKSCLANPIFKHFKNKSPTSISNNSHIHNYFIKHSTENNEKCTHFESPYKDILSEPTTILNDSAQDENDFKSSKPFINGKTENPKANIGKAQNKKRKCRKSTMQKGIQKKLPNMISDNFLYNDTNPEHLQMALALSKSEQSDGYVQDNIELNYPSTQTKILTTRKTLEKFGFKTEKQIGKTVEVIKKPKKSRYQYITPTLYLRTEEDRQNLISSKISLILSQNILPPYTYEKAPIEVKSQYLSDLVCRNACIFNLNNINKNKLDTDLFYVKDLKLDKSNTKCGHLLKDLSKVPGREKTPERKIVESNLKRLSSANTFANDGASHINIETSQENIDGIPKSNQEVVILHSITSKEGNEQKRSNILKCINKNKKCAQQCENIEINLNKELVPRNVSPDLFESEEEDTIEINNVIENKLQSSLEIISNIKRFSLSQSTLQQKLPNIDVHVSVENDTELDLKRAVLECERSGISNTPEDKYNKISNSINLNRKFTMIPDSNTMIGKCDEMSFSEEIMKKPEDFFPIVNMQKPNTTDDNINTNEVKNRSVCSPFGESTEPQNIIYQINSTDERVNLTKNCATNEYSNIKLQLNNTDDILTTLEITLTKNISSATPKNKNINVFSASQLSNFGSLEKSDKGEVYAISSDNSDCSITYRNDVSGIQHFESFYNEPLKLEAKNADIAEAEFNSYNSNSEKTSDKSKNNDVSYKNKSLNNTDSITCVFDQNSSMSNKDLLANNTINNQFEINLECKNIEKQSLEIKDTKSRFERCKNTYEILSDSDNTYIYEFENDNEWQEIYKNSSMRKLLEKSVINHESLQLKNLETASANTEPGLRKSLSFTSPQTNNYKLELSRDFKRHASLTTPSSNKNISFTNKCLQEFRKYSSNSSVSSENYNEDGVICISDEELNYSSMHSTPYSKTKNNRTNMKIKLNASNSDEDNTADKSINVLSEDEKNASSYSYLEKYYDDFQYNTNENQADPHVNIIGDTQSPLAHPRVSQLSNKKYSAFKQVLENKEEFLRNEESTPISEKINNTITPDGHVILKTSNITPLPDYDNMNTPAIVKELQKVGVKQLKRHRGVQILKHIYETTHPVTDNHKISEDENDNEHIIKRRKVIKYRSRRRLQTEANSNNVGSIENKPELNLCEVSTIEIVGDIPESGDLIFERKQSKKISGCPIPLHIVFHNLVSSNQQLKQNILLYEPLQLEVLYGMLKEQGYKYHIQDLLTFLDKKCVTVRTGQNLGQRRRH